MKNILFLLFLLVGTTTLSQSDFMSMRTNLKLPLSIGYINTPCIMTINYWEYISGKSYNYINNNNIKNLNHSIKFVFNKKSVYIYNNNYFYYKENGRKYKFIF